MKAGSQAWGAYGKRTNSFLLMNYGFCNHNNIYDSFEFYVKMKSKSRIISGKEPIVVKDMIASRTQKIDV